MELRSEKEREIPWPPLGGLPRRSPRFVAGVLLHALTASGRAWARAPAALAAQIDPRDRFAGLRPSRLACQEI